MPQISAPNCSDIRRNVQQISCTSQARNLDEFQQTDIWWHEQPPTADIWAVSPKSQISGTQPPRYLG
jgi:hypothetical protein